ncbi:MAG: TRAM domain-containing protein [Candidatus Eremiobacteraeota bacterium]|nr:TRAM domain-containing protein [Candidatus Eremiobacteraeota bacterium]
MFYIILSIFGGLLGYQIGQSLQKIKDLDPSLKTPHTFWSLVMVGILMGIALAPLVSDLFMKLIDIVVLGLKKLSLQETILGAVGLIFGLIIAMLINLALGFIPFEDIAIVGRFIKPFLYLMVAIFWGYLGIFFATRMVFVKSFGRLFSNKGGPGMPFASSKIIKLLDTSVIIDGRIQEICKTGFIEGDLTVPRFVLNELQAIADSADSLKRNRGRRGLDVLHHLTKEPGIQIYDKDYDDVGVDTKLVKLAQELGAELMTTDYNLAKVAQLQGLIVLNVNELANSLKPVVLPGEEMEVKIIREGKESGQGVGYLDDGTMIVVEDGKRHIGEKINATVTSVIQTVAGKMIFSRARNNPPKSKKR